MAAGALSSSSRHRKLAASRRESRRNMMAGSQTNSAATRGGSQRNLITTRGGSKRNLIRPTANTARGQDGEYLAESMPTLFEGRKRELESLRNSLDDSMKSNPELYMNIHHAGEQEIVDDGSANAELRHRQKTQNEEDEGGSQSVEDGGTRHNVSQGESSPIQNNHSPPNRPSLKDKDSFNENTAIEPTIPRSKYRLPSYLNPFNSARKIVGIVVNDERVQNTVLLLIMINAVMMGVATFPSVKNNPDIISKFELADLIFLIIFTVESAMQLIYHGWTLLKDGFLVFDLLIVVMSWALEGTQVFRAFRIFRAMRLITRIDVLKNLVSALFSVVPKMTAIFLLLMLIFYIFSVMFTQLFKGVNDDAYFDSLFDSLFTLFQMMTLDNWADILFQVQQTDPWAWMPFVVFIVITGFVIVNLMIAVICDAVHVLGNEGKARLEGYGSEDFPSRSMWGNSYEGDTNHATGAEHRLQQLQQQLDEMVMMQEQMRTTIEVLITQLQENAAKKAASMSIETDFGEIQSQFRTWSMAPTDSLGGQISRSRTLPIPTDS
eukprot:CAMPEP_0172325084 /NCGR_PEP_ID=MMETSP1058-20130122/53125_1 /TAXON_ID=83371 /ORGANISM="Detonula confervacea, Strain CCMP 353" /LENGTH=548 /DNA_ID=CAMNT_0013041539 /DNA_START=39 /DNA_END=1682 /DNA_ORIENTATION=+